MKVHSAMQGIARYTGTSGSAAEPPMNSLAIGARKNMCIRYIPKLNLAMPLTAAGALLRSMQEKSRKAPNEARSTLGVQNSQDHSSRGVSMSLPGVPIYQNDQPVKAAPTRKHTAPVMARLRRSQWRW